MRFFGIILGDWRFPYPYPCFLGFWNRTWNGDPDVSSTRIQDNFSIVSFLEFGCQRNGVGSSGEYHPQRCRFIWFVVVSGRFSDYFYLEIGGNDSTSWRMDSHIFFNPKWFNPEGSNHQTSPTSLRDFSPVERPQFAPEKWWASWEIIHLFGANWGLFSGNVESGEPNN